MIEIGQLRRWNDAHMIDGGSEFFLVIENLGLFLRPGSRVGDSPEEYWLIIHDGKLHNGWSSSLLNELSEVVHGTS